MQRKGMIIGLNADKVEDYKRLHAAVWPEVLAKISDCNITQLLDLPEGAGEPDVHLLRVSRARDYAADMAKMAADPKTQEWWAVCMPCQEPLDNPERGRMVGGHGRSLPP